MHVLKHHNETHYFVHLIHIINVNKNKLVLHLFHFILVASMLTANLWQLCPPVESSTHHCHDPLSPFSEYTQFLKCRYIHPKQKAVCSMYMRVDMYDRLHLASQISS